MIILSFTDVINSQLMTSYKTRSLGIDLYFVFFVYCYCEFFDGIIRSFVNNGDGANRNANTVFIYGKRITFSPHCSAVYIIESKTSNYNAVQIAIS